LELEGIDPDRKTFVTRDSESLDRDAEAQSQVERGYSTRTWRPCGRQEGRPYFSPLADGGVRGRPFLGGGMRGVLLLGSNVRQVSSPGRGIMGGGIRAH
jgi:hypothetical protein